MGSTAQTDAGRERLIGALCALAVVLLFASFTLLSRKGLTGRFSINDIALLRFGVGATLLLPFFLRHGLGGLSLVQALTLALTGGLGFACLAYAGFARAPSAHGGVLLHGTLPLFGSLFGSLFLRQSMSRVRLFGITLIALGIGAIALDSIDIASPKVLVGDAFLLGASCAWGLYGALLGRWGANPVSAASLVAGLSFLAYGAFSVATGQVLRVELDAQFALQVVFQGILIGAVSIFVYSRAVIALGATRTALCTAAVPTLTMLGAIPLLDEWPNWQGVLGCVLATLGMGIALRGASPR